MVVSIYLSDIFHPLASMLLAMRCSVYFFPYFADLYFIKFPNFSVTTHSFTFPMSNNPMIVALVRCSDITFSNRIQNTNKCNDLHDENLYCQYSSIPRICEPEWSQSPSSEPRANSGMFISNIASGDHMAITTA